MFGILWSITFRRCAIAVERGEKLFVPISCPSLTVPPLVSRTRRSDMLMRGTAAAMRRIPALIGASAMLVITSTATANIDLEFRGPDEPVEIGTIVEVGLYAVSDSPENQSFAAVQLIFGWDPGFLLFDEIDNAGAVPLLTSALAASDSSFGLNEAIPPADGDGLYLAFAPLGDPVDATPEGVLLTTFIFEALAPTAGTDVFMFEEGGEPTIQTKVLDGTIPGLIVTGELIPTTIVIESACPGDCAQPPNGIVDVADLLAMLAVWGEDDTFCDLDGNGVVDVSDLLELLANWGACP
jgi:hypothetical protein